MLIRYPGSKARLAPKIRSCFPDYAALPLWMNELDYREPFFGAGGVGFEILPLLPPGSKAWINDIDRGIYALWYSVKNNIGKFVDMIESFIPSIDLFDEFKETDGAGDLLEAGFKKLALHQMSYSGLGFMSGPLGGKSQEGGKYSVSCRWSVASLVKKAVACHDLLLKCDVKITNIDYSELLTGGKDTFIYLDPPYYEVGKRLYKYSFDNSDHEKMATTLKNSNFGWALSYDDSSYIRKLYTFANIRNIDTSYTIYGGKRTKNNEVLITP